MINRLTSAAAVNQPSESVEKASATVTGGKKRIAHNLKPIATYSKNPTATSVKSPAEGNAIEEIKRPTLPLELGAKVPLVVRKRYLSIIIEECLRCTPDSKKTAYDRGLEEEKNVFKRSSNKNIYMNLAANRIKAIRNEHCKNETQSSENNGKQTQRMISHESVLNGPQAAGCSIQRKQVSLTVNDIDNSMLYSILQRFLLSKEDLKKYGFPVLNSDNKEVTYPLPENKIKNNFNSSRRTCCRCHAVFQVNEAGIPIKKEECVFHQGRLWKERSNGAIERKYSCCKGDANSGGCCCASSHVIDGYGHADLMKGYVSTLPPEDDSFPGVYALDCEMCYTTIGLELTRISVIDHHRKCVYESLVKPKNMILDYNTKFSGIQETDLVGVTVTLEDVQKKLKSFINNKTILIGHSLDSDFKALKIIHETVIDTSAVFPHKNGLPQRRALRTITAEFLKKIIQDEVGGHDSQEDAMSCMELMLYKVGQELSKMKKVT
ncbi:RNA exonuclease 1-like protein [Leptotrombidium deliense]|uniref:RNA exonuclease 1-like protein n=1 Tax=Leptotrombidium deliense TaxID=299467 RepID=A0A443SAU3_9ACAR|nr:RNA exonuclease 1-like protein [Leptotrombidium deliense]